MYTEATGKNFECFKHIFGVKCSNKDNVFLSFCLRVGIELYVSMFVCKSNAS